MMERRKIVALWEKSGAASGVFVTLVRVEGSSYRRPGAHLLLAAGEHAGMISGGCLDSEVQRKAAWLTRSGAAVERYSTIFDDTGEIPYGLGCGGQVDLLLEPVNTVECRALMESFRASLGGERRTVVTTLPEPGVALRRAIWNSAGEIVFASDGFSAAQIKQSWRLSGEQMESSLLSKQEQRVHFEFLEPPQRFIIFGAGDDVQPLATMASQLGWLVIVADGRPQLARPERFLAAENGPLTVVLDAAGEELRRLAIGPHDAVALITHSYEQDRALLSHLLPLTPRYLGLLGSRYRASLLLAETAAELGWSLEQCAARLHTPIGLDLGGDAPEAVALAILAEAQAVCHNRSAAMRRLSAAELAAHLPDSRLAATLRAICPEGIVFEDVQELSHRSPGGPRHQ